MPRLLSAVLTDGSTLHISKRGQRKARPTLSVTSFAVGTLDLSRKLELEFHDYTGTQARVVLDQRTAQRVIDSLTHHLGLLQAAPKD